MRRAETTRSARTPRLRLALAAHAVAQNRLMALPSCASRQPALAREMVVALLVALLSLASAVGSGLIGTDRARTRSARFGAGPSQIPRTVARSSSSWSGPRERPSLALSPRVGSLSLALPAPPAPPPSLALLDTAMVTVPARPDVSVSRVVRPSLFPLLLLRLEGLRRADAPSRAVPGRLRKARHRLGRVREPPPQLGCARRPRRSSSPLSEGARC